MKQHMDFVFHLARISYCVYADIPKSELEALVVPCFGERLPVYQFTYCVH